MNLGGPHKLLLRCYDAAWLAAAPLLAISPRLRQGFGQRLLMDGPLRSMDFVDIWMQAASAGEAYLAREVLFGLPRDRSLSVLMTTCTSQGLAILDQAEAEARQALPRLEITTAYFPFDMPSLMDKALFRLQPKAVVLLETELWPGLLAACVEQGVPALVVNGRMTARSLAGYMTARRIFEALAPLRVLAAGEESATRFGLLFGAPRVSLMPNIKFDRFLTQVEAQIEAQVEAQVKTQVKTRKGAEGGRGPRAAPGPAPGSAPGPAESMAALMGDAPLAVFGSVRRQEEAEVLAALTGLLARRPEAVAALFPRHMHRINAWQGLLAKTGLGFVLRSGLSAPPAPGSVVLWDVFGELASAYALARAAFVGGSLRPLGGQNFLEPLAFGLTPVIGPHWDNFAWVGRDIVDQGLVREEPDARAVAERMAAIMDQPDQRRAVLDKVAAYARTRGGGTALACQAIAGYL